MKDLNDLYYYVQVVDHGGFAPADPDSTHYFSSSSVYGSVSASVLGISSETSSATRLR